MRILFIAPEIPWPLNKGTIQRTHAFLKTLASQHEITFSAPTEPGFENRLRGIEQFIKKFVPVSRSALERQRLPSGSNRLTTLIDFVNGYATRRTPYSFTMENDEWREALAPEIHKHDLFFCRYSYLVNVLADVDRRTILIDADDIEYVRLWRKATSWTSGWKSALLALEALKARRYERSLVSQSLKVFVCSEPDKVKLGSQNVSVIRNGVDLAAELDDEIIRRPATMLFLGAMTHEPNLTGLKWFCEEVWPKVIDTVPQASLRIAGYGMSQVDMSFAEQAGIELLGEIDEPSVELQGTQISIVPVLFGTGTRVKIAESLGYGCTVVSTTIGAEGYDDFDEHHGLYRVDESDKMVRVLCELLNDRLNCEAAGLRGRELALQRLDWRFVTAPTLSVIEQRADTVQQAL